ncbi:MAG: hypothetical protein QM775_12530 [Pirellulales bacterium]
MKTTWICAVLSLTASFVQPQLSAAGLEPDFEPFARQATDVGAEEFDLVECCAICRQKAAGGA